MFTTIYNLLNTFIFKMVIVFLIGFIFGISVLSFVIIVSYIIYKIWNTNIPCLKFNKSFFNQYNKKCKKILNKYGDCKIQKIYIIRESTGLISSLICNLVTYFDYNRYINLVKDQDHYNYHGTILFEISTKTTGIKFIKLEKQNSIMMYEEFYISSLSDYMEISINPNKKYTLNKILNKTRERIGDLNFYNWDCYKNNCQQFIKEILISIKRFTKKTDRFIIRDKFLEWCTVSEFADYVFNCVFICYNFIDKYIIDNLFII